MVDFHGRFEVPRWLRNQPYWAYSRLVSRKPSCFYSAYIELTIKYCFSAELSNLVAIHVLIDSVSPIIRRKMIIKKIKNFLGLLKFFLFLF